MIDWVVGAFYLDTKIDIAIREKLDNQDFDGELDEFSVDDVLNFGGEVGFISDASPERVSQSIYGQGTLHLTDSQRLIAGLRYTEDEVYSEVSNFFGREEFLLDIDGEELTGRIAYELDINDSTMTYLSYTRGFKPGGTNLTFGSNDGVGDTVPALIFDTDIQVTYENEDGTPIADVNNPILLHDFRDPNDPNFQDFNPAYVEGGLIGHSPAVVNETYDQETVDAFEIGLKTDLIDGMMRLNTALFYYDYENLQYQATDAELFQGGVGNIPESKIYGAELELSAFITNDLMLDIRLSHTETEITEDHEAIDNVQSDIVTNQLVGDGEEMFVLDMGREFPVDSDPSDNYPFNVYFDALTNPIIEAARYATLENVNGNELAKTPKFTGNIALTWDKSISLGDITSTIQYTYRGGFQHRIFNNLSTDQVPSYETLDFSVLLNPSNADMFIELIGRNITGEDGINARMTDVFGVGATGDELIPPEQYMIRIGKEI